MLAHDLVGSRVAGGGPNQKEKRKEKNKKRRGYSVCYIYQMIHEIPGAKIQINVACRVVGRVTTRNIVGLGTRATAGRYLLLAAPLRDS